MFALTIPILGVLAILQSSTAATADGESCTTSATCEVGSTCYRGLCTPGLNGLPCNIKADCFETAECDDSIEEFDPVCFREAPCDTSEECLLHESCLPISDLESVCSAGTQGVPCTSIQECLPTYECRNSVCNEPTEEPSTPGVPAYVNNLPQCLPDAMNSVPKPTIIELPSWLLGAVGLVLAIIASRAPKFVMKPEEIQRRKTVFKVFLAGIILLWLAYFVLAVIDQVAQQRLISQFENFLQAAAECFPLDSVIYEQFREDNGQFSKQFRIVTAGFFCEVVASIVFTLAILWLVWRYLQRYPNPNRNVQWKKVLPVALAVVFVGLTGIFVGARIAREKVTLHNPYCEIVISAGEEYVTCALSNFNAADLLDVPFSNEAGDICSEMTQQSIETGNIPLGKGENIDSVIKRFTSSQKVVSEVLTYLTLSSIFATMFFISSRVGDVVALWIAVAFIFVKVIVELVLSVLLISLVYKTRKGTVFAAIIATLLVLCELVVQISGFYYKAAASLQLDAPTAAIVCGQLLPVSDSHGVLDRSFSPEAFDILKAFMVFIFAVIGFKELFTSYE